ncbi:AMP-binding protein [Streptomyces sp. NBC_00932]|uniref:AMP-binding protein n=1 Tax=Streptomyces sp. NBC_00932 TaxID=2903690 RepID=UPI00386BB474|nr:AMP-binding protein [Streptomyces sp. NBC_00932]
MPAPRHTLDDWFAASVAAHGDRTALETGDTELTYTELSLLADHLASALVSGGDGAPPRRVGLLAGRSVVAYAGYLAIQRIGAAVVPLGPAFPAERNAGIVRQASLDRVLSDGTAEHPGQLGVRTTEMTDGELLRRLDSPAPEPSAAGAGPDDLAYIMFTSGSTGVPKGVPIRQRNICAYLAHAVPHCAAGPGDRFSQTFELTFDPSVFDMYTAWGSGAALVVPARADLLAPVRFVNRHAITHWNSVPSVISLAKRLRALGPGSMPTLRASMFCGEPLTLQQARAWQRAAPGSSLENAYGPTELTVTCTAYRLPDDPERWPAPANGTVPIGTLNPRMEHRLFGSELCVRGPQRFPGYLDPDNNAGRFLEADGAPYDPATALTDTHWYRTGDRVALLPPDEGAGSHDLPLVHIGRSDQQVQVHGYRVELGEVEAALRGQPGVSDAAAVALATRAGTEIAAAYTGAADSANDVRAALRDRLPAYMVPAVLTRLAALPLNGNGKVDRAALGATLGEGSGARG